MDIYPFFDGSMIRKGFQNGATSAFYRRRESKAVGSQAGRKLLSEYNKLAIIGTTYFGTGFPYIR